MSDPTAEALAREIALAALVGDRLDELVLGQRPAIDTLLAAYMAGGHALIEGVPGIGKTLLARCFASLLGVGFSRVQFTPDLMPADLIGTNVFDRETGAFRLVRGPVFTRLLMADEINRTPPKTQSALLEAMQEGQVTIDGKSHALAEEFFVIATQNPLEYEGVYPLPEAQLDRFQLRIRMGLPAPESELELYRRAVSGELKDGRAEPPQAVMGEEEVRALRTASKRVHVADEIVDYLAALVAEVRGSPHVELGVSPRGALALLEAARAVAILEGRGYVIPDDLKRLVTACWGHRILLGADSELEGRSAEGELEAAAAAVEVPH